MLGHSSTSDFRKALEALLQSVSPESSISAGTGGKVTGEQVQRLSDKLGELLGDAEGPAGVTERRNERGELINEEGLPIVDINESMAGAEIPPISDIPVLEEPPLIPIRSSQDKARRRTEMERVLDLLEEEEAKEQERNEQLEQQRMREEYEKRKDNARKELERLKSAKDMQKKMGKALLKNLTDAREREEKAKEDQLRQDLEMEAEKKSKKPKKKVSFAQLPTGNEGESSKTPLSGPSSKVGAKAEWGDVVPAKLRAPENRPTMKIEVVERFPSKPKSKAIMSPPPPDRDSDDESVPGSPVPADSDEGDIIMSDHGSFDSEEEDEPESPDDPVIDEEFDFDTTRHHREIALEYFKKRDSIGIDAARAMSAHSHEPMDEWDQPDVPLEATLSNPHPKSEQSKFKSSRVTKAYNTSLPSTTPSTSLGASVLPGTTPLLIRAVRLGKVEGSQLVGGEEGESASEEDDDDVKEFMSALRRGQVTNAGAEQNAETLVAALNRAYGKPTDSDTTSTTASSETLVVSSSASATPPTAATATVTAAQPKASKFKLNRLPSGPGRHAYIHRRTFLAKTADWHFRRGAPACWRVVQERRGRAGPALADVPGRVLHAERHSNSRARIARAPYPSDHPTAERTAPPCEHGLRPVTRAGVPVYDRRLAVVFASWRPGAAQMPSMVVESPSFQPPSNANRPARPPAVMSAAVKEAGGPRAAQAQAEQGQGRKVSRFRAERS
ncbi:hypothetical protein EVG20_g6904 [Dentipellis fragilis]|uniref:DUF3835 domain-containing protein n=1 Tax=Dentipellis fragilis TaxID=205917 RepID=A0A4Y9YI71_9AGAM|nr:hypothetical protein EVG20_g6904 [Dentipellis fragilis]